MAQLISMRQRIKAVETIKKITHAMRLISMSSHTRLRHKKVHLENYKNAFQSLWSRVAYAMPTIRQASVKADARELIILVSSQKGLCGTFNTTLFKFFEAEIYADTPNDYIAVGKYAIDYMRTHNHPLLASYNNFSVSHFVSIAQAITKIIIENPGMYSGVTIYCNYQRNFFVQKPRKSIIFPLQEPEGLVKQEKPAEYLFEQSPQELSATIYELMLTVSLEELLFDSLLAEQAARFLSMDASTRNADKLLISMKLEYNKRRQAAITAELTELVTSMT